MTIERFLLRRVMRHLFNSHVLARKGQHRLALAAQARALSCKAALVIERARNG